MKSLIILLCVSLAWAKPAHSTTKNKGRIIGGQLANVGDFPYSAAFYKTEIISTIFCIGALISDNCILTSAQCVEGGYNFDILFGATDLDSTDDRSLRITTNIYYITIGYNSLTLENDVGIVMLRDRVNFTNYIQPIALPTEDLPDYAGVVTFGWGQTSDQPTGLVNELRFVRLVALSNAECRLVFGEAAIVDNMVCVAGNYNEGTCRGDLGSPLIQYSEDGTEQYHAGISSFISSRGCESTDPSGFTRTRPYVSWIQDIMKIE